MSDIDALREDKRRALGEAKLAPGDAVTIPCSQYEALMGAAKIVDEVHSFILALPPLERKEGRQGLFLFRRIEANLAALRSAGIQIEGQGK